MVHEVIGAPMKVHSVCWSIRSFARVTLNAHISDRGNEQDH